MALTDKLSAIGNAIREKSGTTELLTLDEMPTAIGAIETGGGGAEIPDEFFAVSGVCSYRFSYNNMNYLLETAPWSNKWSSSGIKQGDGMFDNSNKLQIIPFGMNFNQSSATSAISINYMFRQCNELKGLPSINTPTYVSNMANICDSCYKIREIPESWGNNIKFDYIQAQNYPSVSSLFQNCYSLRSIPEVFIKNCKGADTSTSTSGSIIYGGFTGCFCLDEIKGLPVFGVITSNMFNSSISRCHRLKNILFDTNEDGTAKTARWKSQTIDLSSDIGYTPLANRMTKYNSGITEDKEVKDDATYQALKDNPDWFTCKVEYSRYNHDSAVNTINSLPDTSAYLATAGGTNTIKFLGASGSATDGGAINTLTEEEIAVAAAKGWTVTLK